MSIVIIDIQIKWWLAFLLLWLGAVVYVCGIKVLFYSGGITKCLTDTNVQKLQINMIIYIYILG